MANPFIFSIGGVSGDQTFGRGKKTYVQPLTIRKPDYFPLFDSVQHPNEEDRKNNRIEPSHLTKAGMPSRYVYLNDSSKPIPSLMPLSLAEVMKVSPDILQN
jgi:hypothetical protein